MDNIRNFSIIAHIDHGKSTLADRLIQYTGVVNDRDFQDQILDNMDIERERGITIKSQAISLPYQAKDGRSYTLNLIDTPGHVDFTYEVSRSLASCEGVLLLIDAAQGVQAQTLANLYLAMEHDLTIIPVINKIDLPSADVERVIEQIDSELGLDSDTHLKCSAKEGTGIEEILEAIVARIPPPKGDAEAPLAALIFDAKYDAFRGTVIYCRIFNGQVKAGDIIRLMYNNATYRVEEVGRFILRREKRESLAAGEVGYIIAGVKTVSDVRTGDTITLENRPCASPLPGFKEVKPVVFASIYPIASDDYEDLAVSLEKYKLNDASFVYEKDSSAALGQGFRCGFLGLLHLDIVQERLEREYDLSIILSVPSVRYRFTLKDGTVIYVDNPTHYPDTDVDHQVRGALHPGGDDAPRALPRRRHETLHGEAGRQLDAQLSEPRQSGADLRNAAGRGDLRLLRPLQIGDAGLRLVRLRPDRLPGEHLWFFWTSSSTARRSTPSPRSSIGNGRAPGVSRPANG